MGPRSVIEGQAAELKRRERWVAAVKRRRSRRRNVGLLAANWAKMTKKSERVRDNLLRHKDQAKHSGGLSHQLSAHKFCSSCLMNGQIVSYLMFMLYIFGVHS